MRWALILLLGLVVATAAPARALTLTEPAVDPRGRALSAANPVYACFLGVEGAEGRWIQPSGPAGGKCQDVTAYRPAATPVPVRVWSACIFRGPLGGAVWGPITSRGLMVTETLGPAPLPLP